MSASVPRRATLGALSLGLACTVAPRGGWAAAPATTHVTDARGEAEIPNRPRRVVVYDLGALDAMQALGMPVAGVPRAQLAPPLKAYAERATVAGTLFEPDFDVLSRLRPDLIIVGGRSAGRYEIVKRIAPTLDFSVQGARLPADIARNLNCLGTLFGRQAEAQKLGAQVEQAVKDLRRPAAQAGPGLLLMAVNERIVPQGPGSRFGLLFDVLGARSILAADQLPARGAPFGFDELARLDPQWLYVIDRNAATGQAAGGAPMVPSTQVFDNAQVRATTAGRKGQVVFLDPKGWYLMGSAGPSTMLRNVDQLRRAYQAAGLV